MGLAWTYLEPFLPHTCVFMLQNQCPKTVTIFSSQCRCIGGRFDDKRNGQKLVASTDLLHKQQDWRQGKGNGLDNGLQQNVKVEKCWRQVYWRGTFDK